MGYFVEIAIVGFFEILGGMIRRDPEEFEREAGDGASSQEHRHG